MLRAALCRQHHVSKSPRVATTIKTCSLLSLRCLSTTAQDISSSSSSSSSSQANNNDTRRRSNNNNNIQTTTNKIPFYGLPRPPSSSNNDTTSSSSSSSSSLQQRLIVALRSASTAFRDPTRDDAVAALGEVTGTIALQRLYHQLQHHPTGKLILQDKPVISKATIPYERFLEQAKTIAETPRHQITFGQAYGHFLAQHGFDPDERKPVQYLTNNNSADGDADQADLAYVMLRYRQCHDYWHALTGLPPTVLGELGLKWLELFQTGLPIAALSGTVGALGLPYKQQAMLWNAYLPWAIRVHKRQQSLDPQGSILTVYYEKEFDTPLQVLQQRIGIEPAPIINIMDGED